MANPIADEMRFLQKLFTAERFAVLRAVSTSHPVVQRYEVLESALGRFDWRDRPQIASQVVAAMADRALWLDGSTGPLDLLSQSTVAEFRQRLADQSQYADAFTELIVKASLEARGISVAFSRGRPDLELSLASDRVVPLEVKHLHRDSSIARIAKVIRKANTQIRDGHDAPSGTVVIRVERDLSVAGDLKDAIPDDVRTVVDEVRRVLARDRYRSVAAVTVMWDELAEIERETDRAMLSFLRRRAEFVEHQAPRAELPFGREFATHFGWTAMVSALSVPAGP